MLMLVAAFFLQEECCHQVVGGILSISSQIQIGGSILLVGVVLYIGLVESLSKLRSFPRLFDLLFMELLFMEFSSVGTAELK